MRAVTETIAPTESEEIAVANGLAVVRAGLGWESDSETRTATLSRFAPVVRATFASLAQPDAEAPGADVPEALAVFEAWYSATYARPFWALFEQYIPEMPLVER